MTLSGAGDRVIEEVSGRKWLAQPTRSESMIWYSRVPTCGWYQRKKWLVLYACSGQVFALRSAIFTGTAWPLEPFSQVDLLRLFVYVDQYYDLHPSDGV